jgi:hypothetical protein
MKKELIYTAALSAFSIAAFAQNSDQVTLNINLYPIQTLEINSQQKVVNLDYISEQDYQRGVEMDQPDHINTYSTGGFTIRVNSSNAILSQTDGQNIPSSDITITPLLGAANPMQGATFTPVDLTSEPREIISNNSGGINKTFGINYKAKGNNAYLGKQVASSGTPTLYTTQIIYSMEAR